MLVGRSLVCCPHIVVDSAVLVQGEGRFKWELRRDSSASAQRLSHACCEGFAAVDCCSFFFNFLLPFSSPCRLYIEKLSVPQEKRITLVEYLQQLSRHRNFLWFVCMNLIQVGAAVTCWDSEDEHWLWLLGDSNAQLPRKGRGVSDVCLISEPPTLACRDPSASC